MILYYLSTFTCLLMAGYMWFTQIVFYPSFRFVDNSQWSEFCRVKKINTSMVQYPIMMFELGSSLILFFLATKSPSYPIFAAATLLLIILWIYNFLVTAKTLKELENGFDNALHQKLLKQNCVKTAGWTLRFVLLISTIVLKF